MPLYEYQCQKCGEKLEDIQKLSDPPYTKCPQCGGELKKLISAPAIQFKGSGFYITDYGRAGSGKSEGKDSAGGETSKKDDSSKPATDQTPPGKKPPVS